MLDTTILNRARNNDQSAIEALLNDFKPKIEAIARSYYINGGDFDDLFQIGLIAFYDAIKNYDSTKNVAFEKFAKVCIHNKIIDAIKESERKKHSPLNSAVGFEKIDAVEHFDPEKIFLVREQLLTVYSAINFKLSSYEKRVLNMYIDGFSYSEIAKSVGKSVKSVTNALCRIRHKLT